MEPPNGHPCPECGAPRQRDNTPACACTHRAAEALRDARTTEAAAAEDFDPLRIRPYVEIDGGEVYGGPDGGAAPAIGEGRPSSPAGATTAPRPGGPPGASFEGTPVTAPQAEPTPHAPDGTAGRPGAGPAEAPRAQGRPGPTAEDTRGRAAMDDGAALPHGDTLRPQGNGSAEAPRPQASGPTPAGTPGRAPMDGSGTPPWPRAEGAPGRAPTDRSGTPPWSPAEGTPNQAPTDNSSTPPRSRAEGTPNQAPTDNSGTPPWSRAEGAPGRAAAAAGAGSHPHTEGSPPGGAARPPSPADATMPLRPVDPDATAVLPAASATSAIPTPLAPAATEPSVTDLRLFDGTAGADRGATGAGGPGARRSGRRRRNLLLAAAGACVAVVAAAGYASGLFSYESPSRDTALPDDIRASVPDAPSSSAASTPAKGSASAAPPAPAAPRPSPSRTASPSASPSPSASASASPSQSPSPSASQPSASATGPGQTAPDNSRQNKGPAVLRLGDDGPEVTELQLRLRQLRLYDDDTDGSFDDRLEDAVRTYQWSRGIQVDDLGVYDRETRAKLESETREP
ncbi:peptidoglycan-binding protein [Streptomyces iakyrus]|uniref:peptidoglycan-binding protein n=1 Tax=Streptomyces iakyrus TaxID=68219 RepID=UPI0036E0C3B0